jgi:plastocyanin
MNGTAYSQNITAEDGFNAFNYTIAAQENLSIALNFSVHDEWGGFISSIFNTSTTEAWGSALYWSWGFYTINATSGAWDYSMNGASFVNVSAGDAIAWAPTFDGTWLNDSLESSIEALVEEIAAATLAEAEKVAMDAFEAFCQNTTHQVTIGADGTSFSPSELEANLGDTICFYWQNAMMAHNVVQVDGLDSTTPKMFGFDSGETAVNGSHLWIIVEPGSSYFICEPHSALGMKLTITVLMPIGQPGEFIESDGLPGFTGMLATISLLGAAFANHRRRD